MSFTVPAGTRLDLTITDELSSRKNKPGDAFTAKVAAAVRDPSGAIVIEEGATVNGSVVAVKPAPNRRTPGTSKVGVGAAAGAVVGRVLSKNTKGTVAGAGVAAETKDLDIVIPDGAHILATITEPMKVAIDRDELDNRRESDTAKTTKTRTY